MEHREIAPIHGSADRERNGARIRRALIAFGVVALVAAALIVASLIWRDNTVVNNPRETASQLFTIVVTLVFGVVIVFFWSMKLTPLLAYRKFLRELATGLSRDVSGVVARVDADTTFRENLSFYGVVVNIGDLNNPEDERLVYWDAQKGRPELKEGDRVVIRAHGNDMIGIEKV